MLTEDDLKHIRLVVKDEIHQGLEAQRERFCFQHIATAANHGARLSEVESEVARLRNGRTNGASSSWLADALQNPRTVICLLTFIVGLVVFGMWLGLRDNADLQHLRDDVNTLADMLRSIMGS
ncbi:MAG: hypothetical protein N2559_15970 [Anaerolineae bacterium]|nr:hypothetical protein [Anaerolineae bacterium]